MSADVAQPALPIPASEIEEALTRFPNRGRATTFADISSVKVAYREDVEFALQTPDMYPARNVAAMLDLGVMQVHAWRRERGIKKARS